MSFFIGQRVANIRTINSHGFYFEKGTVLTVASLCFGYGEDGRKPGNPAFQAVGINLGTRAFDVTWFRPVIERKTDISIFTRMLNPNQLERI